MALSGTITGTTSNKYITAKIDWTATQSIPNNTSTITAKLYYRKSSSATEKTGGTYSGNIVINGVATAVSIKTNLYCNDTWVHFGTATTTVAHNTNGSKTVAISVTGGMSGTSFTSTTLGKNETLNTIPRASSLTASNSTLGSAQTLTITRADSSFKHKITYSCGGASGYAAGSSTTFTTATSVSWTAPDSLHYQNSKGTTLSVTLTLYTYTSDGTHIGTTTKTVTYSIPSSRFAPTIEKLTFTEKTNSSLLSALGAFVKNISTVTITASSTSTYSTVTEAVFMVNGEKYQVAANSMVYGVTIPIKQSGTVSVSFTITDARGYTGTISSSFTVLDYTAPNISKLTVRRCNSNGVANDQGAYVQVTFSAAVTALNNKNTATYTLQYKKSTATSYTSVTLSDYANNYAPTDKTYIFAADTGSSYDVQLTVADSHNSATKTTTASTAFTLMHWKADGTGMGIGRISEKSNALQVGLAGYFENALYVGEDFVRAKRCVVGNNSSSDDNPWYKFASVTTSNLNTDLRISFKVTFGYGSATRFAILNAYIRTPNANGANATQQLQFESNTGMDTTNFVMAHNGSTYELWVKLSAYRFCYFEVLSESTRIAYVDYWTLYDTVSAGSASAPTSGYTQVAATSPYLLNSWPVGSYYMANNSTSPATLFGGTWERIEGRFLYGCAASGTVGATGTHTTGSGSSSLPYVNVALWRRTA